MKLIYAAALISIYAVVLIPIYALVPGSIEVPVLIAINVAVIVTYRKLWRLRDASQNQAEIELERHSKVHPLLVAREILEAGQVKGDIHKSDEQWR